MENIKVTLGDFEIIQLILAGLNFECVSDDSSIHTKIYSKENVNVIVNDCDDTK